VAENIYKLLGEKPLELKMLSLGKGIEIPTRKIAALRRPT